MIPAYQQASRRTPAQPARFALRLSSPTTAIRATARPLNQIRPLSFSTAWKEGSPASCASAGLHLDANNFPHSHHRAPTGLGASRHLPHKILVANRGEIACRVMHTCKAMGIATVAVYSDADADALFVRMADEAVRLGPAPSSESYLLIGKVIEAAVQTGAKMIHPGYGFLSENAEFAQRVSDAGLVFMGPPAAAIRAMGSKAKSKDMMETALVPCVPGYHGTNQDPDVLLSEAIKIDWPVLIKPTAGGGGKGMKVVWSEAEFPALLASAQREAQAGFGDSRVLLERWLPRPRHVEVQIISDSEGNTIHLGTRDCSTQRRHQKVLEEAPAPGLHRDLLERLGQTAVQAAKAAGYKAAVGTVEFLLDATNPQEFFFCEMNTRLQVEHPITEAITGIDLVALQVHVAAGWPLPVTQEQVTANMFGHAFEARLYAEHPRAGYLPSSGQLIKLDLPANTYFGPDLSSLGRIGLPLPPLLRNGTAVRVDTGVQEGNEVSVHYDPMIAKLVVTGADRADALRRLEHALSQCTIVGPYTNLTLLGRLVAHPALQRAEVETAFLDKYGNELLSPLEGQPVPLDGALAAAVWTWLQSEPKALKGPWSNAALTGFRNSAQPTGQSTTFFDPARSTEAKTTIKPLFEDGMVEVVVERKGQEQVHVLLHVDRSVTDETQIRFAATPTNGLGRTVAAQVVPYPLSPKELSEKGSKMVIVLPHMTGDEAQFQLFVRPPSWVGKTAEGSSLGDRSTVTSPMPSRMVEVHVKPGDEVVEGDALVVLEAMKTEHVLRAPRAGIVRSVSSVAKGGLVAQDTALVVLKDEFNDA